MTDETQKGQGQKPEQHQDQGRHLGQQKQQAGEIGKNATHGKSGQDHSDDLEGDDELSEGTSHGPTSGQ